MLLHFGIGGSTKRGEEMWVELADKGINKEIDACSLYNLSIQCNCIGGYLTDLQGTALGIAGWEEMAWVSIGEELCDNGTLCDDLAVVVDSWDQAARVDLQVPLITGTVKVNNNFLELETELLQSNVCTMRPWAAVVGVESDLWAGHFDC
jgi:hypothetical protein